jgi:hypothetical protein
MSNFSRSSFHVEVKTEIDTSLCLDTFLNLNSNRAHMSCLRGQRCYSISEIDVASEAWKGLNAVFPDQRRWQQRRKRVVDVPIVPLAPTHIASSMTPEEAQTIHPISSSLKPSPHKTNETSILFLQRLTPT